MTKKDVRTGMAHAASSLFYEKLGQRVAGIRRRYPNSPVKAAAKIAFWCLRSLVSPFSRKGLVINLGEDRPLAPHLAENRILIVNTDSIGDYILWRNYIEQIRRSRKYQGFAIDMIACSSFMPFLRHLDGKRLGHVFYVPAHIQNLDAEKLLALREQVMQSALARNYHTIIFNSLNSVINRKKFLAEQFITSQMAFRYGVINCDASSQYDPNWLLKFTHVHRRHRDTFLFDFVRNRAFYETLLEQPVRLPHPVIDTCEITFDGVPDELLYRSGNYVVINPCAQDRFRTWHRQNWADVIDHLAGVLGLLVIVVCAGSERDFVQGIRDVAQSHFVLYAGLGASALFGLIKGASLYLGADSGIFHVAAAINVRSLAISAGSAYFRFMNYPGGRRHIRTLFPHGVKEWIHENRENHQVNVSRVEHYSINSVTVFEVKDAIAELLAIDEVVFVNKIKTDNIGDKNICAMNYFADYFAGYVTQHVDIDDLPWFVPSKNRTFIIGGGGLIDQNDNWNRWIGELAKNNTVILWSAGSNCHYGRDRPPPLEMDRLALAGIRDASSRLARDIRQYVPCVSSLNSLLDVAYPIRRTIGVVLHHETNRDAFPQFERFFNDHADLASYLRFIGESQYLITNSYHAMYWATLMGKKVILYAAFSTKFEDFPYPPRKYTGDLLEDMAKAVAYPQAKGECRTINLAFFEQVKAILEKPSMCVGGPA